MGVFQCILVIVFCIPVTWVSACIPVFRETDYTRRQIKNDQPGSHVFWRFLRQLLTDFPQIL